jgi:hypothetical protein
MAAISGTGFVSPQSFLNADSYEIDSVSVDAFDTPQDFDLDVEQFNFDEVSFPDVTQAFTNFNPQIDQSFNALNPDTSLPAIDSSASIPEPAAQTNTPITDPANPTTTNTATADANAQTASPPADSTADNQAPNPAGSQTGSQTDGQQDGQAQVKVELAQEGGVQGFSLSLPNWLSSALGREPSDNPARGAEWTIGSSQKDTFVDKNGKTKLEFSVGVEGDLVRAEASSMGVTLEKKPGAVNSYNANENLLNRAANSFGNRVGTVLPKYSINANIDGSINWLAGFKATADVPKRDGRILLGGEVESRVSVGVNQSVDVQLPFDLGNFTYKDTERFFAEGKVTLGPQVSFPQGSGWVGAKGEAGYETSQAVTETPPVSDSGEPFANLNAAGETSNGSTAQKIQDLFEVNSAEETSMVTVKVSNNNKVYQGPNNQDRATVYEWRGEGKYDQDSNVADKVLAGQYVPSETQARWIREIGNQNVGNPNEVFRQVTAQDLEALNPGKVKTIEIDGEQVKVISAENIVTGVVRNPDGSMAMADSVDLGDGTVVNLADR